MSLLQARLKSGFMARYHGTAVTPTVHLARVLTGNMLTQTQCLNVFVSVCMCVSMRGKTRSTAILA